MRLAIAKKTGYLDDDLRWIGHAFCIEGKAYPYIYSDNSHHCYSVMTESFKKCCHLMSTEFFNKYFRKSEFIEREEFHV
jgi:hypothetical protein